MKKKYNQNGEEILWKWGKELSGIKLANGSVAVLHRDILDPEYAIPFEMGFGGKSFGKICIGNLQYVKAGLLLHNSTRLAYPRD